ncbi:hypothetical protein C0J52_02347 [Blattella germanica]|nr:hypothetical protein C0J52_02347 [Blattella germanica]
MADDCEKEQSPADNYDDDKEEEEPSDDEEEDYRPMPKSRGRGNYRNRGRGAPHEFGPPRGPPPGHGPPRFRGRGYGPRGPPFRGPPPPHFGGPRGPRFRGPPPFDPNWGPMPPPGMHPHPHMMGPPPPGMSKVGQKLPIGCCQRAELTRGSLIGATLILTTDDLGFQVCNFISVLLRNVV